MDLSLILAGLALVLFVAYFLYHKATRRAYLQATILLVPFLDLKVVPFAYGGLHVFDVITYITVITTFQDFFRYKRENVIYFILFCIFVGLIFISSLNSEFPSLSLYGLLTVISPIYLLQDTFERTQDQS